MEEGESGIRRVSGRGGGAVLTEEWDGVRSGHSGGVKAAAASRGSSRRAAEEGPRPSGRGGSGDDAGPAVPGGGLGKRPELDRGTREPRASEWPVPRGWGSELGKPKLRRSRGTGSDRFRVTRRPEED